MAVSMVMPNRSQIRRTSPPVGVDLLEDAVFAKGLWFEVGVAPGELRRPGWSRGALLRVRNRCPSMLPGQVAVRWSRPARNERSGAVDPRHYVPWRPSENFPPIGMIRCARGLLLCTVRPGPPAGKSTGAVERATSHRPRLTLRRGRQRHANRGCVPRKGARRQRTASAGWTTPPRSTS